MTDELSEFAIYGMEVQLIGMNRMLREMRRMVDEFTERLALMKSGKLPKRGRPAKRAESLLDFTHRVGAITGELNAKGQPLQANTAWAGMTAEERSAEMKRRRQVAMKKRRKSAAQTRWDGMSPRQRKQFLKKLADGRRAKAKLPAVKLEQRVNGAVA